MVADGIRQVWHSRREIFKFRDVFPVLAFEAVANAEVRDPVCGLRFVIGARGGKLEPIAAIDVNKISGGTTMPVNVHIRLRPYAETSIAHGKKKIEDGTDGDSGNE